MTHTTSEITMCEPEKIRFRSIRGTEVYMDSYIYGLISNSLLPGALILTEFRPRRGSASLKSFSQAVTVPGAHQSRTNQQAILETNSLLPPGPLLKQPQQAEGPTDTFYCAY